MGYDDRLGIYFINWSVLQSHFGLNGAIAGTGFHAQLFSSQWQAVRHWELLAPRRTTLDLLLVRLLEEMVIGRGNGDTCTACDLELRYVTCFLSSSGETFQQGTHNGDGRRSAECLWAATTGSGSTSPTGGLCSPTSG